MKITLRRSCKALTILLVVAFLGFVLGGTDALKPPPAGNISGKPGSVKVNRVTKSIQSTESNRSRLGALSIGNILPLVVIAVVVITGVLYQQGILTSTSSSAIVNEEEMIEEEFNLDQAVERIQNKANFWFYARLGAFLGILGGALLICLIEWLLKIRTTEVLAGFMAVGWIILGVVTMIAMGAMDGAVGFGYCATAFVAGFLFMVIYNQRDSEISARKLTSTTHYAVVACIAIAATVTPIIHMLAWGSRL